MKKFWNLMLAALVIMGAVACTEQDENVDKKPEQVGLSFEATIDFEETRTDVVFNEGKEKWEMAWVGNETLTVKSGSTVYDFKNSAENKNHFVCTDDGVKDLIGQSVEIFLTHDADGSTMNSKAGKAGGNIEATVESFDPAQGVTLAVKSAFLRYASKHEVTLDASTEIFDYDGYLHNSITLPAGEDVWVAIHAAGDVTLECSINGEVRDTRALNIEAKKIFDLGTLTLPSEPTYIHLVPSNDWKSADAWFSAHFWNESDSTDVTLISYDAEGNIYSCEVPEGMTNVIFCRMNPAYADFAWNSDTEGDHVWNQTADLTVEAAPNNYYYITGWTTGEWNVEGYTPETPEVESIVWSLAGSFNEWGDTLMTSTETANLFVAKGVELKAGDEIKVKDSKTWNTSYGGGITNLEANKWMKAYFNGANIAVAKSGSYDVYFEYAEGAEYSKLYLVDAEGDYTAAVEQTANGTLVPDGGEEPDPDQPEVESIVWSLAGSFNEWGDTLMTSTETANLFVAKGVELKAGDEIKVKDSKTWDTSYGGGITNLEANKWMKAYFNGANIAVAKSGSYDVYFEYAEGAEYSKLYLVDAEGDYTVAVEQTANGTLVPDGGEEPGPDQPAVTPGVASEWALVGAFSDWKDQYMLTTTDANVVVLKNVEMKAATGFLVRKPSTDWADKYGAGNVNYIKANHYITTQKEGADMCLEADGTYDIYFNSSTKNIYIMVSGTDYANATQQTVNGEEPKQEEPEVTDKVVYLKPNSNWMVDNARFAAYFWGATVGEKWVSMTAVGDGTYEAHLPEGYDYGCNIIFCRMNPSTTANNWNNKWNQTADLKTPTDGKNLYTVNEGDWDKGGGTWSVK